MEIGEEQLAFAHQFILGLDGLLHFHDHVALTVHGFDRRQYPCSGLHILVIGEPAALAGCVLYAHLVATTRQLCHSRRGHTHAVLIVLDLFWNSYFHNHQVFVKHCNSAANIRKTSKRCKFFVTKFWRFLEKEVSLPSNR